MPKASKYSKPHDHLDRELRQFGELPKFDERDFQHLQSGNGDGWHEQVDPPPETIAKVEAMKELYRRKYNAAFVRPETPVETRVVPSMVWGVSRGED